MASAPYTNNVLRPNLSTKKNMIDEKMMNSAYWTPPEISAMFPYMLAILNI
jgi:hypothetical protein